MFKPTCEWIKKDMAAAKRAAKAKKPGEIRGVGDPWADTGGVTFRYNAKVKALQAKAALLVAYAAAIGQKRGLLPADMTGWNGRAGVEFSGACNVFFSAEKNAKSIIVPVRNLDFVAAEPIEEIVSDEPFAIAA